MAQHSPEHERKNKKKTPSKTAKSPSSSKKPHVSQSATNLHNPSQSPPMQAVPMQFLQSFQPPQYAMSPPPPRAMYSASPPQHPVYGRIPQASAPSMPIYGTQPQHVRHDANQSAIRFASPPPVKPRDEGPFKEQWDKLDRMAAKSYADLRDGACKGATRLTATYIEKPTNAVAMKSMQALCHGAALYDAINSKFDVVINSIDGNRFSGHEQDLLIYDNAQQTPPPSSSPPLGEPRNQAPNPARQMVGKQKGNNHFSKVWLYSNSRLPPHLPPFKVYMPTYPLLCLAATYSERVYTPPRSKSKETETHIPSDWRTGTKAMVLKSIPVDDMNTVVFAIRGSEGFMDWAVNYNTAPSSPEGFLEDPSNLCHAGFLYVAKKMIKPVADRLRVLLQENPSRSNCSLLITGHSAGGAVAALLYAHMMSTNIESELSYLTGFFKRVHCITFGAPPISLGALQKSSDKRHRKSLFFAFINEGDPIPRADKSFVKSLLKLYATPAPTPHTTPTPNLAQPPTSSATKSKLKNNLVPRLTRPSKSHRLYPPSPSASPPWPIPPCTLMPAGRLIILRPRLSASGTQDAIEAVSVDNETFKKVVYGDPMKHQMKLYKERIEEIATRAVTAGGN